MSRRLDEARDNGDGSWTLVWRVPYMATERVEVVGGPAMSVTLGEAFRTIEERVSEAAAIEAMRLARL